MRENELGGARKTVFKSSSMRAIRLLLVYLLIVFVGGALLAPWLYALTQWGAEQWTGLAPLAKNPFHRFVHRALLGLALILLWPFFRRLGLRAWRDFGFENPRHHWKKILAGFALGFFSLAWVAAFAIALGARKINFNFSAGVLLRHCLNAAFVGMLVAVLEETIFRGALFGGLRKDNPWPMALVVSSGIYALVHFFSRPESPTNVEWNSGILLLPKMLRGFGDFQMLVPGFFTLLLAGMILSLAYQRTGNLFFSIGLHAGWIFWLKSYRFITTEMPATNHWIFGSDKLIDGWLPLPILVLVFLFLLRAPTLILKSRTHGRDARATT